MTNRQETLRVEREAEKLEGTIPNGAERAFCVFLKQVFPGADIVYEPEFFTATNDDGKTETTRPDFRVVRPDGKTIFIEITRNRKNGTDPKERDKMIMKKAAPNYLYVVLYADALLRIQRKNDGFDFFKKEKKKRKVPYSNKGGHLGRAIAKRAQDEAVRAGITFLCKPTVHLDCPRTYPKPNRRDKNHR